MILLQAILIKLVHFSLHIFRYLDFDTLIDSGQSKYEKHPQKVTNMLPANV